MATNNPHAAAVPSPPSIALPLSSRRAQDDLRLIAQHLPVQRRLLHEGETLYHAGQPCQQLGIVNAGIFKIASGTADGRWQLVALEFKGGWLGVDGLAGGHYTCDAIAMDVAEVWTVRYDALLAASARCPQLLEVLHGGMSQGILRQRDALLAVGSLPVQARVADFLLRWADAQAASGLRSDHIVVRLTRAEIGSMLGTTLESVSRTLARLERLGVIEFEGVSRREFRIVRVDLLGRLARDVDNNDWGPWGAS